MSLLLSMLKQFVTVVFVDVFAASLMSAINLVNHI